MLYAFSVGLCNIKHSRNLQCSLMSGPVFLTTYYICIYIPRIYFPASGQAVVTGVVPSRPLFLPSIFIAHRVQQSHCSSSILHRVLLTHALPLSASQFVHKKKFYTNLYEHDLGGFELTKLTYTRLEDNLIRHRGDRLRIWRGPRSTPRWFSDL